MHRFYDQHPLNNHVTMDMGITQTLPEMAESAKKPGAARPAAPIMLVAEHKQDPLIGAEIQGYRVVRPLASGGMANVYVAESMSSPAGAASLQAAVKVLKPHLAGIDELCSRFINEAHAATRIKSDGIVKVMAVDRHQSGYLYILMELLDGMCLRSRLIRETRLELAKALSIIRQTALILQAVHDAEIVHRDLKPENIFLARDATVPDCERVKLLDFGIAKLPAGGPGAVETAIGAQMGTARYMAPEQWTSSERVDQRADLYTLGCIFYEMLTGQGPLMLCGQQHDAQHASMLDNMLDPPERPGAGAGELPSEIKNILYRLLQKNPDHRFESASALVTALDRVGAAHHLAQPEPQRVAAPAQSRPFKVQTRNGRSVAVWPGFDAAELARLLSVVEAMDC